MPYVSFYLSVILTCIAFVICTYYKPLHLNNIIIGATSIAFSLAYDTILGSYFHLYYYINTAHSLLYIVIAGIFLYPLFNVMYTLFLPEKTSGIVIYTGLWTMFMLVFEYISIITGVIVLIKWKVIPWSVLTYLFTFSWVYFLYRYLNKREQAIKACTG